MKLDRLNSLKDNHNNLKKIYIFLKNVAQFPTD